MKQKSPHLGKHLVDSDAATASHTRLRFDFLPYTRSHLCADVHKTTRPRFGWQLTKCSSAGVSATTSNSPDPLLYM
jgi:hypothetical protein